MTDILESVKQEYGPDFLTPEQEGMIRDLCEEGELKLLYFSPSQIPRARDWLRSKVEVSMLVVDAELGEVVRKALREQFPSVRLVVFEGK